MWRRIAWLQTYLPLPIAEFTAKKATPIGCPAVVNQPRRLRLSRDTISGKFSLLRRFSVGDNPHPLRGIRTNRLRLQRAVTKTLRKGRIPLIRIGASPRQG